MYIDQFLYILPVYILSGYSDVNFSSIIRINTISKILIVNWFELVTRFTYQVDIQMHVSDLSSELTHVVKNLKSQPYSANLHTE